MPDAGRRRPLALLAAAALACAALSLTLPWSLAFDPWAWAVWGREVTRGTLDTEGGPSWKPLPVLATSVFALAGSVAPVLWLILARAAGLLALAGAAALAARLAGPVAAVVAAGAMAISDWWLFNTALGNSEGLLAAAALWAVAAHLSGHHRVALLAALAAALLRPEAWPFLGFYALWLWRTRREPPLLPALALLAVLGLWFGPDLLGAGGALGASEAARGTASPQSAVYAAVPALEVLGDFALLCTPPVLLAGLAAVVLGGRTVRVLALGALAWVAIVAVMTQAGYAGNPRYNVAPAAVACVLAGAGIATVARRASRAWLLGALLLATVLAFTAADLRDQWEELGRRAERREDLGTLVARAGGAARVNACAPARTNQPMKAMLAWRLDLRMRSLADPPRAPAVVFGAPLGYAGGPALPESAFSPVARAGEWRLTATCAGGRRLTPAAGGS